MQKSKLQFPEYIASQSYSAGKIQNMKGAKFFNLLSFYILIFTFYIFAASVAYASETNGTILSSGNNGYAWSNQAGWVNFGAANGNIQITDAGITGYAWNQNYGWINMSPSNGGVSVAANGTLSGYAWGSSLGWINFSGTSINSLGVFSGQATGTLAGTLTFDCTNCSVTTDYRPQNSRTATQTTTAGADSGPLAGSGVGVTTPSHLNAFNVPLEITRSQSGILSQGFVNNTRVVVSVPVNASAASSLRISVAAQPVEAANVVRENTSVVSGSIFSITARDENNNLVHSFTEPIQITIIVPEELQDRTDLGVYFFDEDSNIWEKISDVEFSGNLARFYVNHLTLFGIFSAFDLPQFLAPFFKAPKGMAVEVEEAIGAFQPGEAPAGVEEELLPAQLFDIRLLLDARNIARIIDLVARVTFESFGRVPTPVDMIFTLLDENGNELWTSDDTVTVETDRVFVKRFFDAPELESGSYTLRLHTLYNAVVEDDFEATFIIAPEKAPSYWLLWLLGLLIIAVIIILVFKKRSDEEDDTNYQWPGR